jgi:transcriptional regulator with XRE-family HTH domain
MSTKNVHLASMCSSDYNTVMFTPAQSRAARGLIDWSQSQLAAESKVGLSTIRSFESGRRTPITNNLVAIRNALESAGVVFEEDGELVAGGAGVRLRQRAAESLQPDELNASNDE